MEDFKLLILGVLLLAPMSLLAGAQDPMYVWPLGNLSLYNDVMGSEAIEHDESEACFSFIGGPSGLPYSVFDADDHFDVMLKGAATLRNMTVSLFVYTENDEMDITGTILHYQSEDREIMRVRMLANTFLVSFRDEYGMSAGMMYLVNFLTPNVWNHVVVSRFYPTGRIVVYKDGVELYNEDDEFSDVISFPHNGKLRIGKSQDPDDEDMFDGDYACVQMYDHVVPADKQSSIREYCHPKKWNHHFSFYYQPVNGQQCLTDPPDDTIDYSMVSSTTLTRGSTWHKFLAANGLEDSERQTGYLQVLSRDQEPSSSADLIGSFNVTEGKVCARLCMRINGCVGAWVDAAGALCSLYDTEPVQFIPNGGSKFYKLKAEK